MRIKIIGKEKCPHMDKKSGFPNCKKLGRYNPKPMISWNTKIKCDRKRSYRQFIHNDGTIHNIGKYEDYYLSRIKGHPNENLIKNLYVMSNNLLKNSNFLRKISDTCNTWTFKDGEEQYLIESFDQGNIEPILNKNKKYQKERRRKIYERSKIVNDKRSHDYDADERERIDNLTKKIFGESNNQAKLHPELDGKKILQGVLRKELNLKKLSADNDDLSKVFSRRKEHLDELLRRCDYQINDLKAIAAERGLLITKPQKPN